MPLRCSCPHCGRKIVADIAREPRDLPWGGLTFPCLRCRRPALQGDSHTGETLRASHLWHGPCLHSPSSDGSCSATHTAFAGSRGGAKHLCPPIWAGLAPGLRPEGFVALPCWRFGPGHGRMWAGSWAAGAGCECRTVGSKFPHSFSSEGSESFDLLQTRRCRAPWLQPLDPTCHRSLCLQRVGGSAFLMSTTTWSKTRSAARN